MKITSTFFLVFIIGSLFFRPALSQTLEPGRDPFARFIDHTPADVLAKATSCYSIHSLLKESSDSLLVKRRFITTSIYRNGVRLPADSIRQMIQSIPQSKKQFKWATVLKPAGPLVVLTGLLVGYDGISGTSKMATIRGKRTPTQPKPPIEMVTYTKRSAPKVLAGLGLIVGGICLIELSNELVAESVKGYNSKMMPYRKVSFLEKIRVGVTPSNNLGLFACF